MLDQVQPKLGKARHIQGARLLDYVSIFDQGFFPNRIRHYLEMKLVQNLAKLLHKTTKILLKRQDFPESEMESYPAESYKVIEPI